MIYTRDHQTSYIFDPWEYLGPKRRKLMEESWAGLFREHILKDLPVHKLARYFTAGFGRPTKELYTAMAVQILQQIHDLTDEETVSQLAFNIQWHYALDIPGESDEAKYMCPKTLWNLRDIVMQHNLDYVLFHQTTETLAKVFRVDTTKQRLDSVHIRSNMRRLGRIGIFVRSIHTFLVNLKRQHSEIFETLEKELVDRYFSEKALSCFSMVKPSESAKTLHQVSNDLADLIGRFREHPEVASLHSYRTLRRVFEEHCTVAEGTDEGFTLKPAKEIAADSLQNPSDPDATYDGHKGQGYQVQVMETYCDAGEEIREQTLNLITHVELQRACDHDTHALMPALESAQERGLTPAELLADSLYGSDENVQQAKEIGVEVVSPVMGTTKKEGLSAFLVSQSGKVLSCPQGHAPVKVKHNGNRYNAAFTSALCIVCPRQGDCPVKAGKKHHYLRYTEKEARLALRRNAEQTSAFLDKYRWRSGIEAAFSAWDRRMGIKQLRVRGFGAVRFCVYLKAIGINLFRAARVKRVMDTLNATPGAILSAIRQLIFAVKEHFFTKPRTTWANRVPPVSSHVAQDHFALKWAA